MSKQVGQSQYAVGVGCRHAARADLGMVMLRVRDRGRVRVRVRVRSHLGVAHAEHILKGHEADPLAHAAG